MGSVWTLHSTLVGASQRLLLWTLFGLLLSVFSDVAKSPKERKELRLERKAEKIGVLKEEEIMTEQLSGLEIEGVSRVASSLQCVKLTDSDPVALQLGGDVVIGGFFPLHYVAPKPQHSYHSKPQLTSCSG